jgi:hypothetical protein
VGHLDQDPDAKRQILTPFYKNILKNSSFEELNVMEFQCPS